VGSTRVLSGAVHERAPALVIVMDAHANPLRVRGVHRGEYERDREYHQNYEPHDQYSRWETTGAQRRGHWRILVAHVPVIGAEMRSTLRGGAIRVQVPSPHSGSGGTTTRRCATTSEEPICFVVVFTYSIPARDIECIIALVIFSPPIPVLRFPGISRLPGFSLMEPGRRGEAASKIFCDGIAFAITGS
jgi:hypothetical protein